MDSFHYIGNSKEETLFFRHCFQNNAANVLKMLRTNYKLARAKDIDEGLDSRAFAVMGNAMDVLKILRVGSH